MNKVVDPRTTRKRVAFEVYKRNSAWYSQYFVCNYEDYVNGKPRFVLLEKKPEFCRGYTPL